jgi:O-6-methylguanine DNA methyltransferase
MTEPMLMTDLQMLAEVRAPSRLLPAVLEELDLGDRFATIDSPLGPVFVAWNRRGISAVMKTPTAEEFQSRFTERFHRSLRPASVGATPPADGGFDLRTVTEFERAVLLKALEIPRGELRTYGWIAAQIGHPGAVRAVGTALRKNPVPLLIPCHRVVRSDGAIGQYALGGSDAKRVVLASEGIEAESIATLARQWRSTEFLRRANFA